MNETVNVLIEYFSDEVPKLKETYSWKIPNVKGFELSGEKGYKANVELKRFFNKKWMNSNSDEKLFLAKEVVADWGGVRGNKEDTLISYLDELKKEKPLTPLKGVASYSKIFSIVDMDKYIIYDARVAACLNAVQWNYKVSSGQAFNYISGRNNIVGNATTKKGFVYQEKFKTPSLISSGWGEIKRDETYKTYLDTLNECIKSIPEYNLYDLEMVLFANAETECLKAMN